MSTTYAGGVLLVDGVRVELTKSTVITNVDYADASGQTRYATTRKDSRGHQHRWGKTGLPDTARWEQVMCDGMCGDSGCDGWQVAVCKTCGKELDIPTRWESKYIPMQASREAEVELLEWPLERLPTVGSDMVLEVPGYQLPCSLIAFYLQFGGLSTIRLAVTGPETRR